jgi:hypothetical protein
MAAFPVSDPSVVSSDQVVLRAATAAYLGRCRGQTRLHTNSDLRIFLRWCDEQGLEPLASSTASCRIHLRTTSAGDPSQLGRRRSAWGTCG